MFGLILLIAVLAATAYIGRKEQLTRAGGDNSVLAGVCGGIADRYKLPPLAVRAVFAVLALTTGGLVAAIYLTLALTVPRQV